MFARDPDVLDELRHPLLILVQSSNGSHKDILAQRMRLLDRIQKRLDKFVSVSLYTKS